MIEYFGVFLLGIIAGSVTGLVPGVHINLVSALIVSFSAYLLKFVDGLSLGIFVMSMSVTHTFLDSIPSIFLGAPDADMALGVLPGHRLLLRGFGFGAVYLTLIGSLYGLILSLLLVPILIFVVGYIYPFLKDYVGVLLLIIVFFMIIREKKKLVALYIFIVSGTLGLIVLNTPNVSNPLFPLLSGLFGVSSLLLSIFDQVKVPLQSFNKLLIKKSEIIRSVSTSVIIGFFTSFMPGLGPSHGAVIGQTVNGSKIGDKGFLVLIGGLNTVNMVLSLVTLFVLGKARNGSVIALSELIDIDINSLILILFFVFLTGLFSFFYAQEITKLFSKFIERIDYFKMTITVICLISILSFVLSGFYGVLVLVISSAIGLLAPSVGVSRSHAMGVLMVPVLTYFLL